MIDLYLKVFGFGLLGFIFGVGKEIFMNNKSYMKDMNKIGVLKRGNIGRK